MVPSPCYDLFFKHDKSGIELDRHHCSHTRGRRILQVKKNELATSAWLDACGSLGEVIQLHCAGLEPVAQERLRNEVYGSHPWIAVARRGADAEHIHGCMLQAGRANVTAVVCHHSVGPALALKSRSNAKRRNFTSRQTRIVLTKPSGSWYPLGGLLAGHHGRIVASVLQSGSDRSLRRLFRRSHRGSMTNGSSKPSLSATTNAAEATSAVAPGDPPPAKHATYKAQGPGRAAMLQLMVRAPCRKLRQLVRVTAASMAVGPTPARHPTHQFTRVPY